MEQGRPFPEDLVIEASAPLRVDCGGTWDIGLLFLSGRRFRPGTVNIALDVRARVRVRSGESGTIRVTVDGRPMLREESGNGNYLTPLGGFALAVDHFGYTGVTVDLQWDVPGGSGLGGSAAALVALVAALARADRPGPIRSKAPLRRRAVARTAHAVESSLYLCGFQDHLAAAFGGVNLWLWANDDPLRPQAVRRKTLADAAGAAWLGPRLLVAHTGSQHVSAETAREWIRSYGEGNDRRAWVAANEATLRFGAALARADLGEAVRALDDECALRRECSRGAVTETAGGLIDAARAHGCGGRFAGGGAGGCVWALGAPEAIGALLPVWEDQVRTSGGAVLSTLPALDGVQVRSRLQTAVH
jgi:D-glycero-alpha-D-manno-heptose-7-phosphate kinase